MNTVYSRNLYEKFLYRRGHFLTPAGIMNVDHDLKLAFLSSNGPIVLNQIDLIERSIIPVDIENVRKKKKKSLLNAVKRTVKDPLEAIYIASELLHPSRERTIDLKILSNLPFEILNYFSDRNILSARITIIQSFENLTEDLLSQQIRFEPLEVLSEEENIVPYSLVFIPFGQLNTELTQFIDYVYRSSDFYIVPVSNGFYLYHDEPLNIDELESIISEEIWERVEGDSEYLLKLEKGIFHLPLDDLMRIYRELMSIEKIEKIPAVYLENLVSLYLKLSKVKQKDYCKERSFSFVLKKTQESCFLFDVFIGGKKDEERGP